VTPKYPCQWGVLHELEDDILKEELHNLYSSPNIIRQIKSRRMRWSGNVARMGEDIKVYKISVGRPEGKRTLGRPRRRWMVSEWILGRLVGCVWSGLSWLRTGIGGGLL
jgi:hypothetical protein